MCATTLMHALYHAHMPAIFASTELPPPSSKNKVQLDALRRLHLPALTPTDAKVIVNKSSEGRGNVKHSRSVVDLNLRHKCTH